MDSAKSYIARALAASDACRRTRLILALTAASALLALFPTTLSVGRALPLSELTLGQQSVRPSSAAVQLSNEAQTQVDTLVAQAEEVQAEIEALDAQLEKYSENYNKLQTQIDDLNMRMASLRRQLEAAESAHTYGVKKLENHLREVYKSGGRQHLLELVLAADGLEDLVQRTRLVATLVDRDKCMADNLAASTARLNEVLTEIDEVKQQELSLRQALDDERKRITAAIAEREKTLAALDKEIREIIEQERKREEEEQSRLRATLETLLGGEQIQTAGVPQSDSDIIMQLLETAAYYLGIPYVWAGDRPATGFDCSGYTAYVYAQHGVYLPHYSGYQAEMGTVVEPEDIQPGDLLAFGWPVYHVGIYIGNGLFIHAPRTGDVVRISSLKERDDLSFIRRFKLKPRIGPPAAW